MIKKTISNIYHKLNELKEIHYLLIAYTLIIFISILVYETGGTTAVYANLMYIPIIIVAIKSTRLYGLFFSFLAGILLGPYMPLNKELVISQEPINWIVRLLMYILVTFIIQFFVKNLKKNNQINKIKTKKIIKAQEATIYSLVKLAEYRDDDTGLHIERVSELSKVLSKKLQITDEYNEYVSDDYVENIGRASALHDIGKVGISDSILLKPGRLSKEEFEIMKNHSEIGATILTNVKEKFPDNKFLELGLAITKHHHEKWDGSGYPQGLEENDIPLSARIMAVADVYDALRSKRVYKEPFSHERSLEILNEGKGKHFDPMLIDLFNENEEEIEILYEKLNEKKPY